MQNNNTHRHISSSYDKELVNLDKYLHNMIDLLVCAINNIRDIDIAHLESNLSSVIEGDKDINNINHDINDLSMKLITLRQPMGGDLRYIFTIGYVANSLERAGDNIKRVAIKLRFLYQKDEVIEAKTFEMLEMLKDMLKILKNALENNDIKAMEKLAKIDEQIDTLYIEMIASLQKESNEVSKHDLVNYVLMLRAIERCGDNLEKVGAYFNFIYSGKF